MKRAWMGAALLGALLLSGCQKEIQPVPELLEPVGVTLDTAVCRREDIRTVKIYNSAVVPAVEGLSLTVDGAVDQMLCLPGEKVKAGQTLLTLNTEALSDQAQELEKSIEYNRRMYAFQNEQAELTLQMQRLTLSHLRGEGGASPDDILSLTRSIEDGELSLRQSQETQDLELGILEDQLADLRLRLSRAALISPADGVVTYCMPLTEGSFLPAFTQAVFISRDDTLLLSGDYIAASELRWAKKLYALIGGKTYSVTPVEQDESQIISDLRAGLPPVTSFTIDEGQDPPPVGSYAAIVVETQRAEQALCVPSNAVYRDVGGHYVYVIGPGGTRTRQSVTTGLVNDSYTEIREGLMEGDVIYVQE